MAALKRELSRPGWRKVDRRLIEPENRAVQTVSWAEVKERLWPQFW